MNWFEEAFGKFSEISTGAIITLIAIIAVAIIGIVLYRYKFKKEGTLTKFSWSTRELTTAAICVAVSFLLSFIKIFSLPFGGSITPASMLPIMAFAYIYGVKKGLIVGLCYSLLQFIQEPFFVAPMQFVLDYLLSFSLLALAGLAKSNMQKGIAFGCGARFICQFLSGFIFFGMYAPEGMNPVLYSLAYNGSIVGIECAICIGVSLIPAFRNFLEKTKNLNKQMMLAKAEVQ